MKIRRSIVGQTNVCCNRYSDGTIFVGALTDFMHRSVKSRVAKSPRWGDRLSVYAIATVCTPGCGSPFIVGDFGKLAARDGLFCYLQPVPCVFRKCAH